MSFPINLVSGQILMATDTGTNSMVSMVIHVLINLDHLMQIGLVV